MFINVYIMLVIVLMEVSIIGEVLFFDVFCLLNNICNVMIIINVVKIFFNYVFDI